MEQFMRRYNLTSPLGFLAALGVVALTTLVGCGAQTSETNTDPREGRVYVSVTESDHVIVSADDDQITYWEICNGPDLERYYDESMHTLINNSACQPNEVTSEPAEASSPTD